MHHCSIRDRHTCLPAAVNLLHTHIISQRGLANKLQSEADVAAAATAAAAAAAAAAEQELMAEAAAEARKAGMDTSLDSSESLPGAAVPPAAAAAPGPLHTFGLTVLARALERMMRWAGSMNLG